MDCYIGDVVLFAFNYAPQGFVLCNGAMLNIIQYQALYSLIGTTYGGNGSTTFAVPNMLGAEPAPNLMYYIAVQGYYPPRN
jgi:microcystin-dependent protein